MIDDNKKRYGLHRYQQWLDSPVRALTFRTFGQSSLFLQLLASRALPDILHHTTVPSQPGPSSFPSSFRSGIKHIFDFGTIIHMYNMLIPAKSVYLYVFSNISCRAVAMQQQRDWRIYSGHFWATTPKHDPAETDSNARTKELCFLCGSCRDVRSKGQD
jgi:hypothetical protein